MALKGLIIFIKPGLTLTSWVNHPTVYEVLELFTLFMCHKSLHMIDCLDQMELSVFSHS